MWRVRRRISLFIPLLNGPLSLPNRKASAPTCPISPQSYSLTACLHTLYWHLNSWIRAIPAATKLTSNVSSGTASQEVNFWLSLEWAAEGIEAQLRSEEVRMVMDALRNAGRFHATVNFVADTGLKDATDLVHNYNQPMKDLPLDYLPVSSTDLDKVHESKPKLSPYPIRRILPLVEANSRDCDLLGSKHPTGWHTHLSPPSNVL